MNIQNLGIETLKIGRDGRWSAAGRWLLVADSALTEGSAGELVRQWAGNPGDLFKIPAAGGNAVTTDPNYRVETIDIKFLDHYRAEVTFTASETNLAPQLSQAITEVTDELSQISRSAGWLVPRAKLSEIIPAPGTVFDWSGQPFVCIYTGVKYLDADTAELTIKAQLAATCQTGATNHYLDGSDHRFADAVWLVPDCDLDAFLAGRPLYGAAGWAGADYYLIKIQKSAKSLGLWQITLTAKMIADRMLHSQRSEELAGLDYYGNLRRKIVWTSVWQIKAASLPAFYLQSGGAPVNWAEDRAVITKITPQAVSPVEYLLTMTAEDRANPGLFEREIEDNSNLASRKDASVDMADFFISAQMSGYSRDADGALQIIPDWEPGDACPFTASGPLDPAFADSYLKTFVVHETVFLPGRAGNQINNMANWASSRTYNGSAAGFSGNYLKIRQTCSETRDSDGNLYTRINRSYQLAPGNLRWNNQYWANH